VKELPGCRADVDAAIVQAVGGHSFSEDMQVGIFLGQSLRQRLLVPASVPAAVNPELGFGDVALTAPHVLSQNLVFRKHEQSVGVLRVEPQHKSELGGQSLGYLLPILARRLTSIYSAVVLLIKQSGPGMMGQNLVWALAEIR